LIPKAHIIQVDFLVHLLARSEGIETIEVVYSLFRSLVMIGDRPTIEFVQDNVGNLIENARRAERQKEG
jgi:hypothetical protein